MFPSDSASASNVGSMLHQLQQLSAEDPAAFQDAAGNIASRLKSSSATATGTTARALDSLASSFRAAATTGKVPTLASTAPMTASSHVAVAKYAQSISKGGEDESLATLHDALADALAAA